MSLTDTKIRNTKPSTSPFKLTDAHGLYLLINPGGSRLWYLKYRFNSKESRIALGPYSQVSLSDARQQREGIRKLLALKINPAQQRTDERIAHSPDKCFKAAALGMTEKHEKAERAQLMRDLGIAELDAAIQMAKQIDRNVD